MFGKGAKRKGRKEKEEERGEKKRRKKGAKRKGGVLGERSSPSFVSSVYHNPDN